MKKMIAIRPEKPGDVDAVHTVNEAAFSRLLEADLVDKLRISCPEAVSLVADSNGAIVGHILFTPVALQTQTKRIEGMGLGPMAVVPECQNQGIGSRLVIAGLEVLRQRACPFVVVLGHPEYYPRFGFTPASRHGLRCPWDGVPDGVFMAIVLDKDTMSGVSGVVRYRKEFGAVPRKGARSLRRNLPNR
jgi:putative acetyltransferase